MANLTESSTYDAGVYQIETTDPVSGGSTGIANKPLINLANRTNWLKSQVDAIIAGTATLAGYAKLASPTFTGSPAAPTPALGDDDTSLATTAFVQDTVGGVLSKSVAGGVNVTLTAVEAGNGILVFTGALTANISVIVPTSPTAQWIVKNGTSGAFTLTVKTAAGTGVVITQGKTEVVYTDGTNVLTGFDDFTDAALTGTPTAPTAAVNTSTTQIATTAFVNAEIANDAAPVAHVGATGTAHGVATTSVNGFMSSTDKTKLDGVTAGAAAVGSTAGAALASTAVAGTATTAARSDHVHPYPTPANIGAAAASHTHTIANVTDWPTAVSMIEVGYLDGVTSAIQTQLNGKAASSHTHASYAPLADPAFTGNPTAPTASQFDNDTSLATTAFVKSAGLLFSGMNSVGAASNALTNAAFGAMTYIAAGASNGTVTLPPLSASIPNGSTITLYSPAASNVLVQRGSTNDLIYGTESSGSGVYSTAMNIGDTLTLMSYFSGGVGGWYALSGSNSLAGSSKFNSSLSGTGYQKLPSGLIIQWGVTGAFTASKTVTFPIAFPNQAASVIAQNGTGSSGIILGVYSVNLSSFAIASNQGSANSHFYFAIGF